MRRRFAEVVSMPLELRENQLSSLGREEIYYQSCLVDYALIRAGNALGSHLLLQRGQS